MQHHSPLRYPGGKAIFASFLDDVILLNDLQGCHYFEPYAGGAGAALSLLLSGRVSELYLNDADIRVYAFWKSLLDCSEQFVESVQTTPLNITEWHRQREIVQDTNKYSLYDVGFATFYMNRCNRSGIVSGGPIGGFGQAGVWKMDVRFNRENLIRRILDVAKYKDRIHVSQSDATEFLLTHFDRKYEHGAFVYLDPPYVVKAHRLYMNAYQKDDHIQLANCITAKKSLAWIISYDHCQFIADLYSDKCRVQNLPIRYSLQKKQQTQELLISPYYLQLPVVYRKGKQEINLEISRIGDECA